MIIEGRCLDEALLELYGVLLNSTDTFEASKGKGYDLLAPKVLLKDARSRVSATVSRGHIVSALAEFCWYMSGSADLSVIRYYLPDYPPKSATGSIEEAYGPRFLGTGEFGRSFNQIDRVICRLKDKPDTRRAVIVLLESSDLEPEKGEAPCTSTLQFIRRRERLHLVTSMRSNDAYLGFPHDIFCFTMIQEIIARSLGVRLGEYHHYATSLHLYERDRRKAESYIAEGHQSPVFAMPKMPPGCQLQNLKVFVEHEALIRSGLITSESQIKLPSYWKDLALILLRFSDIKFKRGGEKIRENISAISDDFYRPFIASRPEFVTMPEPDRFTQASLGLEE